MGFFKTLFDFKRGPEEPENLINIKEWVRLNRWMLFFFIVVAALALILIVSNVRNINNLLTEIRQLEKTEKEIKNYNLRLNAQIIQLEAPDRIIPIAETNLQMSIPTSAPKELK